MGLWQNLVAGYDANKALLSRVDAGGLYPLSSTTVSNHSEFLVVISLDADGHFKGHEIIPKRNDKKGIPRQDFAIPVTQESLNRTRESYPNPLFDQREYVFPAFENGKQVSTTKNDKYKRLLGEFAAFPSAPPSVQAVLRYVSDPTRDFSADLPDKTKSKTIILFRVAIPGKAETALWNDPAVFAAWHEFYGEKVANSSGTVLDAMTGLRQPCADFHPKKVFASSGNAKLISANDKTNFTFRGLFENASQAISIGYDSSQKAHQFLRYLIANNGIACGEQVIVPFTPRTGSDSLPPPPVSDEDEYWDDGAEWTTADIQTQLGANTGIDYAKAVHAALERGKVEKQWASHAPAAIAVFEAATTGRLSVTYYRELSRREYLEQVQCWHDWCKWPFWHKSKETGKAYVVFGAPSFDRILQAAFGWPKSGQDASYAKLKQRVRAQLLRTVFDGVPVPSDYLANAVRRASNPLSITSNGKFDPKRFLGVLATTCSLLKYNLKYKYHNAKESFDMSLEPTRTDRDYLYGRLLGAADKLEEFALRTKSNVRKDTSALRYMQAFSMRPFTTWLTIHDALVPYKQQVRNSFADRELQTIHDLFTSKAFEDDSPLSGIYLVGYYHERAHLDALAAEAKKKKEQSETVDNQPIHRSNPCH